MVKIFALRTALNVFRSLSMLSNIPALLLRGKKDGLTISYKIDTDTFLTNVTREISPSSSVVFRLNL